MIGCPLARRVAAAAFDPDSPGSRRAAADDARLPRSATWVRRGGPLLLTFVVGVYLLAKGFTDLDIYDEGIRLYGAMRVLDGSLPYRDFFTMYAPAQFYWPALWFLGFGEQLWAARLSEVFFAGAAVAAMVVLLARAGAGRAGVLLGVASILLPLVDTRLITLDPSLALVLCAGLIVTGAPPRRRLVAGGLVLGCASLFRHDFALYGAVAAASALAVEALVSAPRGLRARTAARSIWVVTLSALGVALPVFAALAWPDPGKLWDCLVSKPFELMDLRRIPYSHALAQHLGYLSKELSANNCMRLWVTLGPALMPLTLVLLGHERLRAEITREPRRAATLTFLVVFAAGLSAYAFTRTDIFHLHPAHIMSTGAFVILASAAFRVAPRERLWPRLGVALSVLISLGILAGLLGTVGRFQKRTTLGLARLDGIRVGDAGKWLAQAATDVDRFADDRPIFVGSVRHDRVIATLLTTYFMTRRRSATYYHDIVPGLTTTEPVQRQIIADIAESGACAALLWNNHSSDEPNRSATETGADLLDTYLVNHFNVAVEAKGYRVLTRCGPQAQR